MIARIHLDDQAEATTLAETLAAHGHEVAIVKERFAGEDDGEAVTFVVCTPANQDVLADLLGEDVFVEYD